jgi:hypothetical protein
MGINVGTLAKQSVHQLLQMTQEAQLMTIPSSARRSAYVIVGPIAPRYQSRLWLMRLVTLTMSTQIVDDRGKVVLELVNIAIFAPHLM